MNKVKAFIIPHWHFDALWQLTLKEYFEITYRNLLDLLEFLEKEPSFKFNIDQTIYLESFIKEYPEVFDKLKYYVDKGNIEFVCSGYTQPDSNLPSGEFLARNIAVYQWFIKKIFGKKSICGWFLDVYGQSAQLPQIFRKAGIKYFVFWRGIPIDVPSEFFWEGIDGTKILTHRMPINYGVGYLKEGEWRYYFFIRTLTPELGVVKLESIIKELSKYATTNAVFVPNGNDFTPPQRIIVEIVRELNKKSNEIEAMIATASEFFKYIDKFKEKLTTIKGEFNPIFRGTYTTRIEIKKRNRRCENLYLDAEKLATIAYMLGASYPKEDLDKALKLILTNQFHDAINGEVNDIVYEIIMKNFDLIEDLCNKVTEKSLSYIVSKINTKSDIKGIPIVIFNTLSWSRTDIISIKVAFSNPRVKDVRVLDYQGKQVPHQVVKTFRNPDGSLEVVELLFLAEEVPPMGYKVYYVVPVETLEESSVSPTNELKARETRDGFIIENKFVKLKIDLISKCIVSLYDKEVGKEIIDNSKYLGNAIFMEQDHGSVCHINGDIDGHQYAIPIRDAPLIETSLNSIKCIPYGKIIEHGPLRVTFYAHGVLGNTKFVQRIRVYSFTKRIDFETELYVGDEYKRFRVVFPTTIKNGEIWHEIPYGAIKREEGEHAAINWVDISNDEFGVSLINYGIPGNSVVDGVLILSLLRSIEAMYLANPFGDLRLLRVGEYYLEKLGKYYTYYAMGSKALEKGYHYFKYALYPHKGDWRKAKTFKVAYEFINPLIAIKTDHHEGELPKEMSFVSIKPDNVVLTVLKRAEENNNIVLRFYEATGKHETKAKIVLFKRIKRAFQTNLLEEPERELRPNGERLEILIKPFEISTLMLDI